VMTVYPGSERVGHDLLKSVQQFPQREGRNNVAVRPIARLGGKAGASVLGMDIPLRVLLGEPLFSDDLING
jgi:hypothetical protein